METKRTLSDAYSEMIEEKLNPMTVKGKGATKPGELEGKTKEVTKASGTESPAMKDVDKAEEAPKNLSPTDKNVAKKATTAKESTMPKKSFNDLYNEVINEIAPDIEDNKEWSDDEGDFNPPPGGADGEGPVDDAEMDSAAVGSKADIFRQLADLFTQLADMEGGGEDELPPEPSEDIGAEAAADTVPGMKESVVKEMKSEPEPKEFTANISQLQAPRKLAGKGVVAKGGTAATKGSSKQRTGELETAPEGMKPADKSQMKVAGDGPIHKAGNASFLES